MQVFTSIVVLGLCFAAFVYSDIKDYKQRKAGSMISLAQVIGSNSISAIEFQDNDAGKKILADLQKGAPEVENAGIFDKKGNIFATYRKAGTDTFTLPAPRLSVNSFDYTSHYLLVYNNIVSNNEVIGSVGLRIALTELGNIKDTQYRITLVILIVGLGLAFIIAVFVQGYISKPILDLVSVMKQVGKTGEYTMRVKPGGKDEISSLSIVFNNLMDRVLESQKKKDEFIGIASHELKTPLTSVKAYLQILDAIETEQPQKQYIQKTLDNLNKLQQLVYDLLDVSKIQSGQLYLNITRFNIDEFVDETIASFQNVSPAHEVIRLGGSPGQFVNADRQRIEQVLMNLLSNAAKYSPGADKIFVYTEKKGSDLVIRVKDSGIGIDKEEHTKIFERFYRTKANSILISGFGLGLYICKDIMARHNGKIWLESEKKGTSFYFSLPGMSDNPGEESDPGKSGRAALT
jgi:signal transduction histidine kinase